MKQLDYEVYESLVNRIDSKYLNIVLNGIIKDNILKELGTKRKPTSMLVYGKSGVGKTYSTEEILKILEVPYILVDLKQYSEVGYHGKDISSIFQDLLIKYDNDINKVENSTIILDEFDKIQAANSDHKDVSGIGLQHSLLKILDGMDITVANGGNSRALGRTINLNTKNMTFIFIGAFSNLSINQKNKHETLTSNGFSIELVNRFNKIVKFEEASDTTLFKYLSLDNKSSPLYEYSLIFNKMGCKLEFKDIKKTNEIIVSKAKENGYSYRSINYIVDEMFLPHIYKVYLENINKIKIDGINTY